MKDVLNKFKKALNSGGLTNEELEYAKEWMTWYMEWSRKPKPGEPQPQDGGGSTPPPPPPHK